MCAAAKRDGVAKNLLGAREPRRAKVRTLDAKLWRLVEEGGAY